MRHPDAKWAALACFLIGLAALALSQCAQAFDIIKLDELTVVYRNYKWVHEKNRPALIYPESAKEAFNVGLNVDLLKYGFYDATIESLTTESQFRAIGLQMNYGVRISQWLTLSMWHHSQHVLERAGTTVAPFPVEDAVEFKLYLYRAHPGRDSIF